MVYACAECSWMLSESTGAIKCKVFSPEEQNHAEPKPMFKILSFGFSLHFFHFTLPFIGILTFQGNEKIHHFVEPNRREALSETLA